jgi:hypothetical protein
VAAWLAERNRDGGLDDAVATHRSAAGRHAVR